MRSRMSRATRGVVGRNTVLAISALMLTLATTSTAVGRESVDRPSRAEMPVPKGLNLPLLKATTADPVGDTIPAVANPPVDITSFSADAIGGELVLTLTFDGPIDPPASDGPNPIDGSFDIDTDQNGATGDTPFVDTAGSPVSGLGNEYYVEFFTYDASDGTVEVIDDPLETVVGRVPMTFTANSLTVTIPLSVLGNDDGAVNTAALAFPEFSDPVDKVPNMGSLSSGEGTTLPNTVFLQGGRFTVDVEWTDFIGASGPGKLISQSDDSAVLYFFSDDNWEMLIKVLDGCDINDRYWVFFAATTDVAFEMTVTDTLSDETRIFTNPLGQAADAITDTDAFATCP